MMCADARQLYSDLICDSFIHSEWFKASQGWFEKWRIRSCDSDCGAGKNVLKAGTLRIYRV